MATPIRLAVYSMTGHTRDAATKLAALLGPLVTVETIEPLRAASGFLGYMRAGFGAITGASWSIRPPQPADGCRVLVVGTPVWAGHLPPPIRSYLRQAAGKYPRLALLITQGGSDLAKFSTDVTVAANRDVAARVTLTDADRKVAGTPEAKLAEFAAALKRMI